jgi:hypothetical protein
MGNLCSSDQVTEQVVNKDSTTAKKSSIGDAPKKKLVAAKPKKKTPAPSTNINDKPYEEQIYNYNFLSTGTSDALGSGFIGGF